MKRTFLFSENKILAIFLHNLLQYGFKGIGQMSIKSGENASAPSSGCFLDEKHAIRQEHVFPKKNIIRFVF